MSRENQEEKNRKQSEKSEDSKKELSPTWAQDALADLDEWIEEQGIYIRQ